MKTLQTLLVAIVLLHSICSADDCPALYKRYSNKHTYCKPKNSQCAITGSGVRKSDIDIILKKHNELRSLVATGQEPKGLPSAADMLQMEWDDELARVAQKHASQCVFDHDCNECRKVQNFDVGQNLYQSKTTATDPVQPDWSSVVQSWYDEVKDFNVDTVDSFEPEKSSGVVGHFTQVIWAKTWKVGCGYSSYTTDQQNQLYTCNYGPGGNVNGVRLYTRGDQCTQCPNNTCCADQCKKQPNYPGLCQVTGNRPVYPRPQGSYSYYCDFGNVDECQVTSPDGNKQWSVYNTLSGSYVGIVLKGGELSALNFSQPINQQGTICIYLEYRKGPNVAGQKTDNVAKEFYHLTDGSYDFETKLNSNNGQFQGFGFKLTDFGEMLMSLVFSVPKGSPEQYFEVTNVGVKSGKC